MASAATTAMVVHTYVGYPAIVAALAALAARRGGGTRRDASWRPRVTVLIPAHNEVDVIERKVDNALGTEWPAALLEVVVVDDGSDDGTAEVVEGFGSNRIRLLRQQPRQGKASGVNAGVAAATGDVVVLTDASAVLEPSAVASAVARLADPSVGVVSGQIRLRQGGVDVPAGLYWRYEDHIRRWESESGSTVGVNGNLFAFRRADFSDLPPGTINDEFTIALDVARRGLRIVYEPAAITYDEASATTMDEYQRRARITAGRLQWSQQLSGLPSELRWRVLSHKMLRALSPVLLLHSMITTIAIVVSDATQSSGRDRAAPTGAWRALLAGYVTLTGAAGVGLVLERTGRRVPKPLAAATYFVAGNVAGAAGWWRWLRGSQDVRWQKRPAVQRGP